MAACSAYNCSNKIGQNIQGCTFHRFPLNKPELLAKWLKAMHKEKWQPTQNDVLCSDHFEDNQFLTNNNYRFLTATAIPSKFEVLAPPKKLFPNAWPPRLITLRDIESENRNGYVVEARIPLSLKEEFNEWLKEHGKLSQVTYDLLRNYPTNPKNLIFKAEYVCHESSKSQQTSNGKPCPSRLLVRIRADPKFRFSKPHSENDSPLTYPCTVVLYHLHNHTIGSNIRETQVLPPEEVSTLIKQKFIEMFKGGYSPSDALSIHKSDLLEEYPDEFNEVLNDTHLCPTIEWLNTFYSNFIEVFGEWTKEKVIDILKDEIEDINATKGQASISISEDNIIIALSTSLMQRSHLLKSSGEIVFVDSSGFLQRCKCYVYILMAYSCTEGLPLGLIITTSNTQDILTEAFKLLAEILPSKAFGQFGKEGPEVFLTENDDALQNSLKAIYPNSTVLLSSYNLSHSLWQWLWNRENNIDEEDRCLLFSLTYKFMQTKSAEEFTAHYEEILTNVTVIKYENFMVYFENLKSLSDRWGVSFKNEILDKNKEVSSIEMASHVLKDKIFLTKSYNILQLLKYLTETMETYYRNKIINCINNTLENFYMSSFSSEMQEVSNLLVNIIPTQQYAVKHQKSGNCYYVDTNICVCSCDLGRNGARCKHLYAICLAKQMDFTSSVPDDEIIKRELYWIATDTMKKSILGTRVDTNIGNDSEMITSYANNTIFKTTNQIPTNAKKQEARKILDRIVNNIMEKFDFQPFEFYQAIVTAAVNYQNLNNSREIITALRNFGKPSQYHK